MSNMLRASLSQERSLDGAREIYDTEATRPPGSFNLEVLRLIEAEWIMMSLDVPMHRLEGESDVIGNSPWFYSSWAAVDRSYDEERQNGTFLQAQLRKKLGAMGCNKLEIHSRLVDTKGWRDVFSESERALIICPSTATIAVRDAEAEGGYRSIVPEDEEAWEDMLGTLEQLKQAEFSDMLLLAPDPVWPKASAAS